MSATIRSSYQQRVAPMPVVSSVTDAKFIYWLRALADVVNGLPPMSSFSTGNPNSQITALRGAWGYNLSSATSAVWFKQVGSGTTGWVPLA